MLIQRSLLPALESVFQPQLKALTESVAEVESRLTSVQEVAAQAASSAVSGFEEVQRLAPVLTGGSFGATLAGLQEALRAHGDLVADQGRETREAVVGALTEHTTAVSSRVAEDLSTLREVLEGQASDQTEQLEARSVQTQTLLEHQPEVLREHMATQTDRLLEGAGDVVRALTSAISTRLLICDGAPNHCVRETLLSKCLENLEFLESFQGEINEPSSLLKNAKFQMIEKEGELLIIQ